jgi:hypothetical protein
VLPPLLSRLHLQDHWAAASYGESINLTLFLPVRLLLLNLLVVTGLLRLSPTTHWMQGSMPVMTSMTIEAAREPLVRVRALVLVPVPRLVAQRLRHSEGSAPPRRFARAGRVQWALVRVRVRVQVQARARALPAQAHARAAAPAALVGSNASGTSIRATTKTKTLPRPNVRMGIR